MKTISVPGSDKTVKIKTISTSSSDKTVKIRILFHFLAPFKTWSETHRKENRINHDRIISRIHEIISSLNDDFNNYTTNNNLMNNLKYKNVVIQVFSGNSAKQSIYLGSDYQKLLPQSPSSIIFEFGELYYYPVTKELLLDSYDSIEQMELQFQAVKQYIHQHKAYAICPKHLLNIWIIDMNTPILSFPSFPWDSMDDYHGIVINLRAFFPEDYFELSFNMYKTLTHAIGHYLGLLHYHLGEKIRQTININECESNPDENATSYTDICVNPLDKNERLHTDHDYNPLFMNFMDHTYDRFVNIFTQTQIVEMKSLIIALRPQLDPTRPIPTPKYIPSLGPPITCDLVHSDQLPSPNSPNKETRSSYNGKDLKSPSINLGTTICNFNNQAAIQGAPATKDKVKQGTVLGVSVTPDTVPRDATLEALATPDTVRRDAILGALATPDTVHQDSIQRTLATQSTVRRDAIVEALATQNSVRQDSIQGTLATQNSVCQNSIQGTLATQGVVHQDATPKALATENKINKDNTSEVSATHSKDIKPNELIENFKNPSVMHEIVPIDGSHIFDTPSQSRSFDPPSQSRSFDPPSQSRSKDKSISHKGKKPSNHKHYSGDSDDDNDDYHNYLSYMGQMMNYYHSMGYPIYPYPYQGVSPKNTYPGHHLNTEEIPNHPCFTYNPEEQFYPGHYQGSESDDHTSIKKLNNKIENLWKKINEESPKSEDSYEECHLHRKSHQSKHNHPKKELSSETKHYTKPKLAKDRFDMIEDYNNPNDNKLAPTSDRMSLEHSNNRRLMVANNDIVRRNSMVKAQDGPTIASSTALPVSIPRTSNQIRPDALSNVAEDESITQEPKGLPSNASFRRSLNATFQSTGQKGVSALRNDLRVDRGSKQMLKNDSLNKPCLDGTKQIHHLKPPQETADTKFNQLPANMMKADISATSNKSNVLARKKVNSMPKKRFVRGKPAHLN